MSASLIGKNFRVYAMNKLTLRSQQRRSLTTLSTGYLKAQLSIV